MIAEKTAVKRFPTPLVNRLEKHFVLMSSVLTEKESVIVNTLLQWIIKFSNIKSG